MRNKGDGEGGGKGYTGELDIIKRREKKKQERETKERHKARQ